MPQSSLRILAFGAAVDVLGGAEFDWQIAGATTVGEVIAALEARWPRLSAARGKLRFALNQQYATAATPAQPGDELAIIPPVSGGSSDQPASLARLTHEPIDTPALVAEVEDVGAGAIMTFLGVVRAEQSESGKPLVALNYHAYEPMALQELQRACDAAVGAHRLIAARVTHRLGRLRLGEASIAIVVSAAHRAEAFEGCRAIIEDVKVSAPIFKQEEWGDGGASWVNPI